MSHQAERGGLVPRLRFPEFRDAGEWDLLEIDHKIDLLSGYPFDGAEISEDATGIRLLRGINITEGRVRHSKEMDRYFLGDTENLERYKIKVNDLVVAMDGSKVGKNSALITDNEAGALLVQRVARIRSHSAITIKYIFHHINSVRFHRYVDKINTSSGIPHISAKQIKEFQVCFPHVDEQQKIVECLASLDERITLEAQQLDTLKAHKKGLMQQLFPAEGETLPQLRFPEFRDAGEWNNKPLEAICVLITKGTTPTTLGFQYLESGISFIKIESIDQGGLINCEKIAYISEECNQALKRSRLAINDILFSIAGALGVVAVVPSEILPANTNQALAIIRLKPGFSHHYLVNYLSSQLIQSELSKIKAGAAQPNISLTQLGSFQVLLPELMEQQKIADCLASLDDLITAQTQKLTALKTHKQGLMQQLFPAQENTP